MQKKKKMLLVKMGSLLGKVCVEKGDYHYGQKTFAAAYTLRIYTNNYKHTF